MIDIDEGPKGHEANDADREKDIIDSSCGHGDNDAHGDQRYEQGLEQTPARCEISKGTANDGTNGGPGQNRPGPLWRDTIMQCGQFNIGVVATDIDIGKADSDEANDGQDFRHNPPHDLRPLPGAPAPLHSAASRESSEQPTRKVPPES